MDDQRFEFGENWQRFASTISDEHVQESTNALGKALGVSSLAGLTFLDVGGGSGIHSLSARRLGAKVHSFDYDHKSVACMEAMRARFSPNDPNWAIEQGSALDPEYLEKLGQFDVVYSWGVLHHTGNMWLALDLVERRVKPGGTLYIALYNDQGMPSRIWHEVKKQYVQSSRWGKKAIVEAARGYFETSAAVARILNGQGLFRKDRTYKTRGMQQETDLIDWVGGYPFEVSKPDQIFNFYRARGYELTFLKTCGAGHGCNEFVFKKLT